MTSQKRVETAILAGGCFWCMVSPFEVLEGVLSIRSGYSGGHVENPTYEQVKSKTTGHYEVVKIDYDPELLDYELLLKAFWMQINPMDDEGQFQDRGPQYRSGIFYTTQEQREKAEKSKAELEASGKFPMPILTPILPAGRFYDAEDYHQDFYKKDPVAYKEDRGISGRDEFIKEYWGEAYFEWFK